jgi:hypothetical protein
LTRKHQAGPSRRPSADFLGSQNDLGSGIEGVQSPALSQIELQLVERSSHQVQQSPFLLEGAVK